MRWMSYWETRLCPANDHCLSRWPETGLGEINDGFLEADFGPHFIIRPPEITSALPVTLHQRTQPAREKAIITDIRLRS